MKQIQRLFTAAAALVVLSWIFGYNPFRDGTAALSDAPQAIVSPSSAKFEPYEEFATFQQQQHTLSGMTKLLTVVETVEASSFSLGHLQNQLKSFFALFDTPTLAEFVLITTDKDADAVKSAVGQARNQHHGKTVPESLFRYLTYSECADELDPNSKSYFSGATASLQQQLARLACAKHITTPFYLNLETGVFFARSCNALSFFKESNCSAYSAVCNPQNTRSYQAKNDIYPITERDFDQKAMLLSSASLLKTAVAVDWRPAIGVMPQIFAKDVALQLGEHLRQKFKVESWQTYLLRNAYPDKLNKRQSLSDVAPSWDAYNLYWLYAVRACVFENYHVPGSVLQASAFWTQQQFDQWTACDTFHQPPKMGLMSLVHSDVGIPASTVWSKIEPCLG